MPNGSSLPSPRTHGLIDSLGRDIRHAGFPAHLRDEFGNRREVLRSTSTDQISGIPSVTDIKVFKPFIGGHFLERFLIKETVLTQGDIKQICAELEPHLNAVLIGNGAVPASINDATHYSKYSWTRDAAMVAFAWKRDGKTSQASDVLWNIAEFYGGEKQRPRFDYYHFASDPVGDYRGQKAHPHSMARIGNAGKLEENPQPWGHEQLDTIGWFIFLAFRLANDNAVDLKALDTRISSEVNPNNKTESIFPLALKFLTRINAWNQPSRGPWEDILMHSRATDLGVLLSAATEAKRFYENHPEGYNALPVTYGQKIPNETSHGELLRNDLHKLVEELSKALARRVPAQPNAIAQECDDSKLSRDSGMAWLLYPGELSLHADAEAAILRTVYQNMREIGFIRRPLDNYVGQDYARIKGGSSWQDFSDASVPAFREAQWTIFDPLLSAYFSRRYVDSKCSDDQALTRADIHLKRALSMMTSQDHTFPWDRANKTVTVPARCFPEAYWLDTTTKQWLPNHNSPLLMANAALSLALLRYSHALDEKERGHPNTSPNELG